MKADFVNAFLDPVVEVWRSKLSSEATFREAEPVTGTFTTDSLVGVVSVTGNLEGNVFYEFPEATALALATALGAEEKTLMDAEVYALVQEFVRSLAAGIPDALGRSGFRSQLSPPVLLAQGAQVTVTHPQIWAHFDSNQGSMGVRVSVREVPV
jgi:CheY-specific phosphatase CheX